MDQLFIVPHCRGLNREMGFINRVNKEKKEKKQDVLLQEQSDRRLMPDVPALTGERKLTDRRGKFSEAELSFEQISKKRKKGIRYLNVYQVTILAYGTWGKKKLTGTTKDISLSGVGLIVSAEDIESIHSAQKVRLKFHVEPGSLPEGMEMNVDIYAKLVREKELPDGKWLIGVEFATDLSDYARHRKDIYMLSMAALMLFFISAFILLMRSESIIYFKFNKLFYLYSIITAFFLMSRYLFGALYRPKKVDPDFTPGVSVIIPCFNEETWIQKTIQSCINQNYPPEKLEVIVVDDRSTDRSVEKIKEIVERLKNSEDERYHTGERISYIVQPRNAGKREALAAGLKAAKHEYVVFVDSDSFLDPFAVRNLVQPFKDPKMGGVTGRTDVANTYTNSLTKLQSVRYYIAFRIMKAAESYFDCVTCLSGPLSCYKKELVMENLDSWLNQRFLGQKATFGDDRSLTNLMLRNHRTYYQDTAVCSTIVPNDNKVFLKQQMRWKRSWLRESFTAGTFIWKKQPFAAVFFYVGLFVPILAPVVVIYNLVYVPITTYAFPTTFMVGMIMMAMMMSAAQMLLRKSTTWIFGFLFCMYYEAVLLWQMPIAIVTFWKSTWGTRMTTNDVEAKERKEKRKQKREGKKGEQENETGETIKQEAVH